MEGEVHRCLRIKPIRHIPPLDEKVQYWCPLKGAFV